MEAQRQLDTGLEQVVVTSSDGGHGLGLSIARRAIELHGGTISAATTGSGLCVTVALPVSD